MTDPEKIIAATSHTSAGVEIATLRCAPGFYTAVDNSWVWTDMKMDKHGRVILAQESIDAIVAGIQEQSK